MFAQFTMLVDPATFGVNSKIDTFKSNHLDQFRCGALGANISRVQSVVFASIEPFAFID